MCVGVGSLRTAQQEDGLSVVDHGQGGAGNPARNLCQPALHSLPEWRQFHRQPELDGERTFQATEIR